MNELTVVDKGADWRRLKSPVLDSVSSPITKRVYNLGLDEFFAWFSQRAAARIYEGPPGASRWKRAGCAPFPSTCGSLRYGSWQSSPLITGFWHPNWQMASLA